MLPFTFNSFHFASSCLVVDVVVVIVIVVVVVAVAVVVVVDVNVVVLLRPTATAAKMDSLILSRDSGYPVGIAAIPLSSLLN